MAETWVKIPECGGKYEVSDFGNVRNSKGQKLRPFVTKGGYLMVALCEKGHKMNFRLHRLIAKAFVPNNDQKAEVNHKNGIKTDNRASNLEWSTKSENMRHAYTQGLQAKGRYIVRAVQCEEDGLTFTTIGEAARYYGLDPRTVRSSCARNSKRGKRNFRYYDKEKENG